MSRLMKTLMMALVAGVIGVSAPSPGFAAGGESDDSTPSAVRQARDAAQATTSSHLSTYCQGTGPPGAEFLLATQTNTSLRSVICHTYFT